MGFFSNIQGAPSRQKMWRKTVQQVLWGKGFFQPHSGFWVSIAMVGLVAGVSGCGTTATHGKSPSTSANEAQTSPGQNSTKETSGSPGVQAGNPGFTLARLNSLVNYTYQDKTMIGGAVMTTSGAVHSPTNYQIKITTSAAGAPSTTYISRTIKGTPYLDLPGVGWQKGTPETPALKDFATFVMDDIGSPNQIKKVGQTSIAGQRCEEYRIFPSSDPSLSTEVWVDDQNGALLKYVGAKVGLPSAKSTASVQQMFVVNQVGGVPAWPTPSVTSLP